MTTDDANAIKYNSNKVTQAKVKVLIVRSVEREREREREVPYVHI